MRILLVHNQLWAHYKSKLFSEIQLCLQEKHPESEFLVVHVALYEASRSVMQDHNSYPYTYPYKVLFNRSLDRVRFPERLIALFKAYHQFKPTILNVTGYFDWAQVLLMAYARSQGVKVVLSSESSTQDHNRSAVKEKIKSRIVNQAHAFFCFGTTSASYLLSLGVKPDQIAVRHAAVIDEEVIRAAYSRRRESDYSGKQKFIYVGRLAPEKNLEMLIRAFANVVAEDPDNAPWELVLVGDGPSRPALEELAQEKTSVKIQFAGGVAWYQVPEWLAQSTVLVLPSKSEPWGLVVNEAMVCGMPVIVSDKCGCVEDLVMNDVNGFTFNPEKTEELENAMRFMMQSTDEHLEQMGRESKKLVVPFSSQNVAAEMVTCYSQLETL